MLNCAHNCEQIAQVVESVDTIKECKTQLQTELDQLKTLVGLRTSVPKEQVYVSAEHVGDR